MALTNFLLSVAYLVLALAIGAYENKIRKKAGFDSFHVVLFFYGLYVLAASSAIHGLLAFNPHIETGVYFFDSVYTNLDSTQAWTIFLLNLVFLAGFYLVRSRFHGDRPEHHKHYMLRLRRRVLAGWLLFGSMVCGLFFWGLGETFIERYANLILFRSLDDSSERTFFTANAFSVTMTFSWLSAAMFFCYQQQRRRLASWTLLLLTIVFSFLMGSRRGFIFPIIIIYLSHVITFNRTFARRLIYVAPIAILWISFGKNLTSAIARDADAVEVLETYTSADAGLLRAVSDIGIGQVQSIGVLQHFDFEPRYGIDHMLSFLRRIPGKSGLGITDYFPEHERITRITTALFTSADDADIAPGLIGASWLDFPVFGAIFWGMGLALQAGAIQYCRIRIRSGPVRTAITVLFASIVAMPINTGSYDFTVSVDIVLLIFIIFTTVRCVKLQDDGCTRR